jgi:hypothetical protein
MLSTTVNAVDLPKTAQKLPQLAQRQNFEIPPKFEILVFLKNKNLYV